jgi:hypothetical protein
VTGTEEEKKEAQEKEHQTAKILRKTPACRCFSDVNVLFCGAFDIWVERLRRRNPFGHLYSSQPTEPRHKEGSFGINRASFAEVFVVDLAKLYNDVLRVGAEREAAEEGEEDRHRRVPSQ